MPASPSHRWQQTPGFETSRSVLQFLTTVHFGAGVRDELPALLALARVSHPLWVTDKGVIQAGVLAQVRSMLPGDPAGLVFDQTPVNPTESAAVAGAQAYQAGGCDGLVAVGGGAALDQAKAIAILVSHPGPLWQYCNRHAHPAAIGTTPALFMVPTTAGTGSEVGRSAVIVFDNGIKAGVRCPNLVTAALCDPELTLGLPASITAATGMDALAHCIETYCSPTVNPPADSIAIGGMARIFSSLRTAVRHGDDLRARWNMMMGSLEGAICFQKGMGAVHALSHPLGALGFHHGTLNAVLLPHVLAYNQRWIDEAKWNVICDCAGLAPGADLGRALTAWNHAIGIAPDLKTLGVAAAALEGIAAEALQDNAHRTNPRPMTQTDYLAILQGAYAVS